MNLFHSREPASPAPQPSDLTLPVDGGMFNLRVGAILLREGQCLMVGNDHADYLYSVGGRVRFGETLEDAVRREVLEETGVLMEIDRLGFVHENFFVGDWASAQGRLFHELSFFFYMRLPPDFSLTSGSLTKDGARERLIWVPLNTERKIYPEFFRTELAAPSQTVKHIVTDERTAP